MTDEIKTEQIATPVVAPAPAKKPSGNPNWRKKKEEREKAAVVAKPAPTPAPSEIRRADVIDEPLVGDQWEVLNKDPKMHYVWVRKSDDREMSQVIQRGYLPARGKEVIMRNPLDAVQDGDGQIKVRGDRVLMMCPKHLAMARRLEAAKRYSSPTDEGKASARKWSQGGVRVESQSGSETKFESLKE